MALRQSEQQWTSAGNRGFAVGIPSVASEEAHTAFPSPATLGCATEVGHRLLNYLQQHFGCNGLEFVAPPTELPGGWETYTYTFQLKAHPSLPAAYLEPLVIRLYCCETGLGRARYEFAVQRHLEDRGYSVGHHLLLEEDCHTFGGPFLLARRITGRPLLYSMLHQPWMVVVQAMRMARLQIELHQLPLQNFPQRPGDFLGRTLKDMQHVIRRYGLTHLRAGLQWLLTHRPAVPRRPSILHLDFHPFNIMDEGKGRFVVIDWTEAEVGDPHADVAHTLMSLECMPHNATGRVDCALINLGRWLFLESYLQRYRAALPLKPEVLCYYRAFAVFRRLCLYGRWLAEGPTQLGWKPEVMQHLDPAHFQMLEQYFQKWTGRWRAPEAEALVLPGRAFAGLQVRC